jgi:hypothetical protein
MKKITILFLILALALGLTAYFLNDSFSLKNIEYEGDLEEEYSPPPLSPKEEEELNAILQQSFSYLGKGHQSYAFLNEDQRYVLKFFKFTYLKPSWFSAKKQEKTRQKKLRRMFIGYRIAYEKDRDNTGVLFVHLSKTSNLKRKITVKDRFGLSHSVDLDRVFFVIQQKAKMTRHVLQDLLDRRDLEAFKQRLHQLFDLYLSEYQRGLFDGDHNIMSNTGFLPARAIRIDVGRLAIRSEMQEPEVYMKDLRKVVTKRIDKWVKINYPKDYDELHEYIESTLNSYAKKP